MTYIKFFVLHVKLHFILNVNCACLKYTWSPSLIILHVSQLAAHLVTLYVFSAVVNAAVESNLFKFGGCRLAAINFISLNFFFNFVPFFNMPILSLIILVMFGLLGWLPVNSHNNRSAA